MSVLNVSNSSTSSNGLYNYVNVCNNVNDYAGFGYECIGSSNYMMRFTGITLTINGETKTYLTLFHNQNSSAPVTWSASILKRFTDTFGYDLTIPSDVRNAFFVLPFTNSDVSYNNQTAAIPDFDNPIWLSYNNYSSYSPTITYKPVLIVPPSQSSDDPSVESGSDYSGIISAITLIPATIIVVCLFKMIANIFLNKKVRG